MRCHPALISAAMIYWIGSRALAQDPAAFRESLLSLVEASRTGFETLKGEQGNDDDRRVWRSRQTLTGARICEVMEGSGRREPIHVTCTMFQTDDQSLGMQKYQDLLKLIADSLPTSWTYKDFPPDKMYRARGFNGPGRPSSSVLVDHINWGKSTEIHLTVYAP